MLNPEQNPPHTWLNNEVQELQTEYQQQAEQHQAQLTKPPGSLGRLETVAARLAGMQGQLLPRLERAHIVVFAADHGVAEEGVSAFPQVVTTEMIKNFSRGGAAISVLAKHRNATLEVVDVGSAHPAGELPGVIDARVAAGTANFTQGAAMQAEQCTAALAAGREALKRALDAGCDLFIGGEMGIANTTSASALACAWLARPATDLVGPGTGVSSEGVRHKAEVIEIALQQHRDKFDNAFDTLCALGGFEIAALCGAYTAAAQAGVPVLIDGFISSVALLAASRFNPRVLDWCFFAHRSAEPGHARVLEALQAEEPLLLLEMRLGEGSGAALALDILRSACVLHAQMATFEEAGVSPGEA